MDVTVKVRGEPKPPSSTPWWDLAVATVAAVVVGLAVVELGGKPMNDTGQGCFPKPLNHCLTVVACATGHIIIYLAESTAHRYWPLALGHV